MLLDLTDRADLAARLTFDRLIAALAAGLQQPSTLPLRTRLDMSRGRELLVMPAADETHAGVKLLTVVPEALPVIKGLYVLFDFTSGRPLAILDADELTARRTAAVSALAARQLSRPDSRTLLIVGSGHLVPYFAEAMLCVRRFETVRIWARDAVKARAALSRVEARLRPDTAIDIAIADDLAVAVGQADVVTCLTRATVPVVLGDQLCPGTHLDLVGGYRPDMREVDDAAVTRSLVFVDDRAAVLAEAGDLIQPIASGSFQADAICGDLADLARGLTRKDPRAITLFKSVGTAAADLVAARAAIEGA